MNKRVFLNTNPIIYLLENRQPFANKVVKFLVKCMDDKVDFYTSTITDVEFLVQPYTNNDLQAIKTYLMFLDKLNILKCYINEQIAEQAAKIRAKYPSIKLGDAIQLATSIDCGCDCFYTNDYRLKQVKEANIVCI